MSHDPFAPESANEAPAPPAEDTNAVPAGTRVEIMAWVGADKDRAKRALDAEKKSGEPRKTLVAELNGVLKE